MSLKPKAVTITELRVACDEARGKKYKKGKFLGKVCSGQSLYLHM